MAKFKLAILLFLSSAFLSSLLAQDLKMYVSDAGNFNLPPWYIFKFDADGSNGEVFISDNLAWPQDIYFIEEENIVLISNLNSGQIVRFDATDGTYKDVFASGIGGPTRMKLGSDGMLYVLQWAGNGKVKRYALNGDFVDDFTSIGVPKSIGLDWDNEGNLYVSSYDGFVRKFNPEGEDLGIFINNNLNGPTNIWFDTDGSLFVLDYNGATVRKFTDEGEFDKNLISSVPSCEGVDFLPNGNILIGVGGTASVRLYNPEGELINTVVPSGALGLLRPNAVVLRDETTTGLSSMQTSFVETNIVHPSIGTQFQIVNRETFMPNAKLEVRDIHGVLVMRIELSDSTSLDASGLSDGVYMITLPIDDLSWARQRIVIQH